MIFTGQEPFDHCNKDLTDLLLKLLVRCINLQGNVGIQVYCYECIVNVIYKIIDHLSRINVNYMKFSQQYSISYIIPLPIFDYNSNSVLIL